MTSAPADENIKFHELFFFECGSMLFMQATVINIVLENENYSTTKLLNKYSWKRQKKNESVR